MSKPRANEANRGPETIATIYCQSLFCIIHRAIVVRVPARSNPIGFGCRSGGVAAIVRGVDRPVPARSNPISGDARGPRNGRGAGDSRAIEPNLGERVGMLRAGRSFGPTTAQPGTGRPGPPIPTQVRFGLQILLERAGERAPRVRPQSVRLAPPGLAADPACSSSSGGSIEPSRRRRLVDSGRLGG
jgi:hypothetical protein